MAHKILLLLALLGVGWVSCESSFNVNVLMPNVSPKTKDIYLCYRFKLDEESPLYITGFRPNSTKQIAHHILLYGCQVPGSQESVWDCGEMHANVDGSASQYKSGPVCGGSKQSIIYAWAMDAPKLVLPKDVAFKVGANTEKAYLVLQVHYANVDKFLTGNTDDSGVVLVAQKEPVPNTAGVYLLETGGYIRPRTYENFETACEVTENVEIVPFAYRTHAHKLGVVNSGYVIKTDPMTGRQTWTEIGRRSPQLPQMFFPASNNVTVGPGDILAARCTMQNFKDHNVFIGSTGEDEMCNFYIMYYVRGEKTLEDNICMSAGPPTWYFKDFRNSEGDRLRLSKIPSDIGEVPVAQLEEMSDMDNHMGMVQGDPESKRSKQHVTSSEEVGSDEVTEDSIEDRLKALEARYVLNKLMKQYFDQNSK